MLSVDTVSEFHHLKPLFSVGLGAGADMHPSLILAIIKE